jgi:hypothetical protein
MEKMNPALQEVQLHFAFERLKNQGMNESQLHAISKAKA